MRILILGGDGMLGHCLLRHLAPRHDVRVTLRGDLASYAAYGMFSTDNSFAGIDVRSMQRLAGVIDDFRPEAVVNCIGIVKQRDEAKEIIPSLEINALFPHRLAAVCKKAGARMIHLSTDCVFSGKKGMYLEIDVSDAEDIYGRTKYLGEVNTERHCVTLRTSIIGRELSRKKGLFEWFLSQAGEIRGYQRAIFSGFTTLEMSRVIEKILVGCPGMYGRYHVSSDPISKYDLLMHIKEKLDLPIRIVPDESFCCDRSLDSKRFRGESGYVPPAWDAMIDELVKPQKENNNDIR